MREGLILFFLGNSGLKVFSLEDLPAIEALDVVYAIPAGNNLGTIVVTSGLHNDA
jgi:hypothetical protein